MGGMNAENAHYAIEARGLLAPLAVAMCRRRT
jgi:hypothetical protein